MVHPVEERFQVDVHGPRPPLLDVAPGRFHGHVGAASGPEAVGMLREGGLEEPFEHLEDGLLDETVQHRGHPEGPHPAGRLGDLDPSGGGGSVVPGVEPCADLRPVGLQVGAEVLRPHPVDPWRAAVALDAS